MSPSLRRRVRQRAGHHCEFCHMPARLDPISTEIDHIVPQKHRGKDRFTNLAEICVQCNRHKGPNLSGIDPRTRGLIRLFNPRRDVWTQHFLWRGAMLVGLTAIGRVTIDVLAINEPQRVAARAALIAEGLGREFT